ncbi:hypothetical protein [Synechococcus elongatus]|uniref:Uncharacterized protein n=2 Tax=Synechococcus elongatus TaxID=32046 RepID=Q31PB4_SYNE7|nr:hypothetical protein [Synechococcus elongatus]ABB57105.1 conserved hypothetical protein [Synechococcus elongatus PCC 7942 = FACHB-805]AJD58378.1 hypothetical protein M744_11300 [Synechococcus elongatus UTEX 2973]MBD2587506.1 hypothetical protein [Synechococcus elongatus FACHB-242]MBD2688715.1 hypothetical protein [Synechococcus elongatus FACHB-1061]MBD2707786.1 hypothetical protein [Synechococcus elongatus PCC 7942 = FACHB-805]
MKPRKSLDSLHGQVHRFIGVVDRFGRFEHSTKGSQETICIRDLHLADTDTPITPDHWWFKLRDIWLDAGVRVGDRVLFTVKVQRGSKGVDGPDVKESDNPRRQVMGCGSKPRSVAVLQRANHPKVELEALQREQARERVQLAQAQQECQRLQQVQEQLVEQNETLAQKLAIARTELEQEQQALQQLERAYTQLRFALRRSQHWSRPVLTAGTALAIGFGTGFGVVQVSPFAPCARGSALPLKISWVDQPSAIPLKLNHHAHF